ncbi:NADP oxidoreductase [Streptomyces antioxidans]|uniref:NADP oxidoreductase n=1 Tax=Streptomyces antioxidans TaxID=1507734 RepID=A0A1V4CTX7_9ACTN|nr:NAD(P)-binding domain-containing protein [Streptomyces antioxidans]OPF70499.1 NADP oxidoreductase [Streptomyces antioxidans]
MRIGVLGTGNMADALGTQWAGAGHELLIGGRSRPKAEALAGRIGHGARAGGLREAAGFGGVTLLAVAHEGVEATLEAAGAAEGTLSGRALIDCTNAVVPGSFTLATDGGPGMAERIAARAVGARVVKGFCHCAEAVWRMTPPVFADGPLAVPLCGDDEGALEAVRTLVRDMGCVPLDAGGLERARLLESTVAFLLGFWFGGVEPRAALPPLAAQSPA